MPLLPSQIQPAQAAQQAAAHDPSDRVRIVAGPGTGKSAAIEERVRWLLGLGVQPVSIVAVSFTRASALDLRHRVHAYCAQSGLPLASQVSVTTLHSLALRTLRAAGLLTAYPSDPLVLDSWETEEVFDAEFGHRSGFGKQRQRQIRSAHEALWSTGQWGPPTYIPPNPPISAAERTQFDAFHGPRTQTYSCVLPGEIVRQCVQHMAAGTLNAAALLGTEHLIVDEFQDLNPMDIAFVDALILQGAKAFIAGDDDQSIYSFRFASPSGIQSFPTKYPGCGQHALTACFRCTPAVLGEGQALIAANPLPNRIPKSLTSLYAGAVPPVGGMVQRWRFPSGVAEARAIAESSRDLIQLGINPRDILILLAKQPDLLAGITAGLDAVGAPYELPHAVGFLESLGGRLILTLLRIICDPHDYVAHRVLLGLRPGVGIKTCDAISQAVISNNLNYRAIFYQPIPANVFAARSLKALGHARAIIAQIQGWQTPDTLAQRTADITSIVAAMFGQPEAQRWQTLSGSLPSGMALSELRDYLWADTDDQQASILTNVLNRLGQPVPQAGVLPPRVRIMTMHGAKGLSARVVFIPGLEEEILPGPWRQPFPGLVLEAARLLYVSITRGRAACIISAAKTRLVHGQLMACTPSRFSTQLGGGFVSRTVGLTTAEAQQIAIDCSNL